MYIPIIAPIAVKIPAIIGALYPNVGIEKKFEDIYPPTKINIIENIVKAK